MKSDVSKAVLYYALYPLIMGIALLPFSWLYKLSDRLFVLVFRILRYRRSVVMKNLNSAFPEKDPAEREEIAVNFYRFLCDFLVETAKYMVISKKEILQRMSFANTELLERFIAENQSVIFVLGHYGNWEWAAPASSLLTRFQLYVIYKKLSNPYFNKLMLQTRSRFGTKLMEMRDVAKEMYRHREELTANIFVGDQTPFPDQAYWTNFLNQDTPVFRGAEILAKKFNYPVVYTAVQRTARGYYTIHTRLITDTPKSTPEGYICETFCKYLEEDIKKNPELWLWSHRRWKHKKPQTL